MKRTIAILLSIVLILPLFGCGNGNNIWKDASPGTSLLVLYRFDEEGGRGCDLSDRGKAGKVLNELSAIEAVPVTDWTADKIKFPVYGVEIGSKDGMGILAAWSDGYLILRDGSVYSFDFDFAALEEGYEWDYHRGVDSLSAMPCGRLLSEGTDGWISGHLKPAEELTPPEGIIMTLKEHIGRKITVTLTNNGNSEWTYGEYFSLQVQLEDVWYNVPVTDDKNYIFHSIGYMLPEGESREESYSLGLYGNLPAGNYRFVMQGMNVEFTIG